MMLFRTLCAFTAGAAFAAPSFADTVFTDRMAFEAAFPNPLVFDSFEDLPATSSAQEDQFDRPGYVVSAVNEGFEFLPPLAVQGPTGGGGTFATDGVRHLNVGSLYSTSQNNDVVVTFTFDTPILAWFADITDLKGLDQAPNPRAFLETDQGLNITLLDGQDPTQDLLTIGFISDSPVSSFTIRATAGDSFGFDAISFGIPSPGGVVLFAAAGLALGRRRRG
jgi:hypothetical protein